ncbi:hypothetical protein DMH88_19200 [Escherichia coli]|nr:hypothetical protein [Escherichia coli]
MLGDNLNIDVVAMVPIIIVDMKLEVTLLKIGDITVGNIMSAVSIMAKTPKHGECQRKDCFLGEKCIFENNHGMYNI